MNTKPLVELNACPEAVDWASTQESPASAWRDCQRGDWMLWLVGRLSGKPGGVKRRRLVLCACECARLALKYVKAGEDRPRLAIEAAEKWARHEGPTLDDVRAAAAYADAATAAYAAAAAAAYAAAAAAYAADADAAARDRVLSLMAQIAVDCYRKLDAPGIALLDTLKAEEAE